MQNFPDSFGHRTHCSLILSRGNAVLEQTWKEERTIQGVLWNRENPACRQHQSRLRAGLSRSEPGTANVP